MDKNPYYINNFYNPESPASKDDYATKANTYAYD